MLSSEGTEFVFSVKGVLARFSRSSKFPVVTTVNGWKSVRIFIVASSPQQIVKQLRRSTNADKYNKIQLYIQKKVNNNKCYLGVSLETSRPVF